MKITHQIVDLLPGTGKDRKALRDRFGRSIDDVTLDKLAVFEERQNLGMLAAMVRLQERAAGPVCWGSS